MSAWRCTRVLEVRRALERIGWRELRRAGSHRVYVRDGWAPLAFAFPDEGESEPRISFYDEAELGPRMLARIAKQSGLWPRMLARGADEAAP